jgi:hypothetical protein
LNPLIWTALGLNLAQDAVQECPTKSRAYTFAFDVPSLTGLATSVDPFLVLHGSAKLTAAHREISLGRGSIILVPSGSEFVLETKADDLVVFQAGLPLHARGAA